MKPPVVEVVGVWGAGKSSLVSSIADADRSVHVPPALWDLPTVALLRGGVRALRPIGGLFRAARRPRWKEARQLARLHALEEELRPDRCRDHRVVLFDEGPVVLLSWLRPVAHETGWAGGPAAWWPSVLRSWACALDLVVFLDAPNPVLAERIRTRPQRHPLKNGRASEVAQLLERQRAAYLSLLAELQTSGLAAVLSFRTDRQSLADISEHVLDALARGRDGR